MRAFHHFRLELILTSRFFHICPLACKKKPLKPSPKNFMKFPVKGSIQFVARQLSDPYVKQRLKEGYRSRSVYKLKEIDDVHNILKPGLSVVDLGAAPGSWSQVVAERVLEYDDDGILTDGTTGQVIAIDLLRFPPVDYVKQVVGDFTNSSTQENVIKLLKEKNVNGKADVVLCDAAPRASGHKDQDHIILVRILSGAAKFALKILKPRGTFLFKLWNGSETNKLFKAMSFLFSNVKIVKPDASRDDSSELYILCKGYKVSKRM